MPECAFCCLLVDLFSYWTSYPKTSRFIPKFNVFFLSIPKKKIIFKSCKPIVKSKYCLVIKTDEIKADSADFQLLLRSRSIFFLYINELLHKPKFYKNIVLLDTFGPHNNFRDLPRLSRIPYVR